MGGKKGDDYEEMRAEKNRAVKEQQGSLATLRIGF